MTTEAPVLSAGEILKATGGSPIKGGVRWSCRGLSTDTRTLRAGNLFIALTGDRFDGHDYLGTAEKKGPPASSSGPTALENGMQDQKICR